MAAATHDPTRRTIVLPSPSATDRLGVALGRAWRADTSWQLLVASLVGDLGAGKTHLSRALVTGLGGRAADVTSPTFALLNLYETPAVSVAHLDCYRLASPEDAFDAGFDDVLAADGAEGAKRRVVLVEWAERLPGLLAGLGLAPAGAVPGLAYREIEIHHGPAPEARTIHLAGLGLHESAAIDALGAAARPGPAR